MILFKVLSRKFFRDDTSQFENFRVNFYKFHALLSMRLSQARLSQILHKVGSENAHRWAQNAENGFGFDVVRAISQRWWWISQSHYNRDETCVSSVNVETKEQSKQCMHTHSPNKMKTSSAFQEDGGNCFLGQERSSDGGIHATKDLNNIRSVLWNTKITA
jgi:hypothetical protein